VADRSVAIGKALQLSLSSGLVTSPENPQHPTTAFTVWARASSFD
jgi:hypothetical protein